MDENRRKKLIALAAYWAGRASGRNSKSFAAGDTDRAVACLREAGIDIPRLPRHPFSAAEKLDEFCGELLAANGMSHWRDVPSNSREASDLEDELCLDL